MRNLVLPILTAALLGLCGSHAFAAVADTTSYGDLWLAGDLLLHPGAPCDQDEVIVYVRGYVSTPCDSFIGVSRVPGQPITIRTLVRPDWQCLVGPSQFFAVPVSLGRLATGFHSFVVRRRTLTLLSNGTLDSTTVESRYEFAVTLECRIPAPVPAADLPFVDTATTNPVRPCPTQPLTLALAGHFLNGCGRLIGSSVEDPGHVSLELAPYPPVRMPCTMNLEPWDAIFPLGLFEPGSYRIAIHLKVRGTNAFWPPTPDRFYTGEFPLEVGVQCDSLPPGPLPFVEQIQVMPKEICSYPGRTLCPGDSILVAISGQFPGFCCAQAPRIELLPSPIVGPLPEPPIVRIVVDYDVHVRCACSPQLEPFYGTATLPPLPARTYGLIVELLQRGGGRDSTLDSTIVPFQVVAAESCGAGAICLTSQWQHQGPYGSCDAYVSTDRADTVTLMVNSKAALSGLQGRLRSWEQGLLVTGIEPVGAAAGMHLEWSRTSDGARFVLFAEQGAPIPAGQTTPILAVQVRADAIAQIPEDPIPPPGAPVFHLAADELLGSDQSGNGILQCPPPPCVDMRMAPDVAVICREQACDFNADGLTDVRDIVLMVHCALQTGPCPPDVGTRFDCDGSGAFAVADVVCCAMHMLRAPGCPSCPLDSVRVEPGIAVRFDVPRRIAGGVEVPFNLEGFDRIGAARLHLRFPADRFTAQVSGGAPLYYIQEVEGDRLTVGLIGAIPGPIYLDDPGPLVVRLLLRPGRSPGGELRLEDGQMSGPDGVLLGVNLEVPSVPLGGGSLAVSEVRPNPFSSSTRFTIALDAPGRLDVSVHDVSGRRLAGIFHGARDAGLQEFTWNGQGEDGSTAPNGIYFLRVDLDGRAVKRKLVLIRGR